MRRSVLLAGAASMVAASAATAQTAQPPPAAQAAPPAVGQPAPPVAAPAAAPQDRSDTSPPSAVSEVVVTGSRIQANGFQQPTPVTVVSDAEIARQGPVTIADYLNQLPAFGNATSEKNPAINVAGGGVDFVNLRNLGFNRTLVLLDNRRVVEATTAGGVDTVTLPIGLIKRVEVVTGGASAAWDRTPWPAWSTSCSTTTTRASA